MCQYCQKNCTKQPFLLWQSLFVGFFVLLVIITGSGPLIASAISPKCYTPMGCGVGGRLTPAACPIGGDCDVQNFPLTCSPTVTVIGPEGTNWGIYQWGGFLYTPGNWAKAYVVNGFPFTHAGEYMLGRATINPNFSCPLPLLRGLGNGLLKAGLR